MAKEQIALSVKDVSMKFNLSSEKVDNVKAVSYTHLRAHET